MTPRNPSVLLLAVALSGCAGGLSYYGKPGSEQDGLGGDATPGGEGPDGSSPDGPGGPPGGEQVDLAVDAVEPRYGPNGGGTEVEVLGTFDDATEILFDGEAAKVLDRRPDRMIVEVPPANVEGWVDVRAVSGDREASLPDGFQYWADGHGLAGAMGEVGYVDMVGGYWVDDTDLRYATLAFTEPLDWEPWRDYATSVADCQFEYVSGYTPRFYDPGASFLELRSGAAAPRLVPQGNGIYQDGPNAEVVPDAVYDLGPIQGNADWPILEVPGIVEVPPSFRITTPNVDRATPPGTNRAIDLAWTGGGGDYMLIFLLRQFEQSPNNWVDVGYVTCAVPDTGSFTVPPGLWPDWFANDLIHIQLGRVVERRVTLPHNGAETRVAGVYWVYGAALTN